MSIFNFFNRSSKKYISDYSRGNRHKSKNGLHEYFYDNSDMLWTKFNVSNGEKDGEYIEYFESGEKKVIHNFKDGNQIGESLSFNKNGCLKRKRNHDSDEITEYYNNGKVRFEFYFNQFKLYNLNGDFNLNISVQYKENGFMKFSLSMPKFLPINVSSGICNYRNSEIFKNYNGEPWYGKRIRRTGNLNGEIEEVLIELSDSNHIITFNYDGWFDLAYLSQYGSNEKKLSNKIIQISELNIECISESLISLRRDDPYDKETTSLNSIVKFKEWDEFKGKSKFISYSKDETCLLLLRLFTYLGGSEMLLNSDKIEDMIPGTLGKYSGGNIITEPQVCKFEIPGKNNITIIVKFLGLVNEVDQNPEFTYSNDLAEIFGKTTGRKFTENLPNLGHNKYVIEIVGDISDSIPNSECKYYGVS